MNENILGATFLKRSAIVRDACARAIDDITRIVSRGQHAGAFRKPLDPVDLHMTISALSFFNVANQATFSAVFGVDMTSPAALALRRAQVVEAVLRYARRDGARSPRACGGVAILTK